MEIDELSAGLNANVAFVRADGSPAQIDGDPRWSLSNDAEGNPVAALVVDEANPFHATITPLPVPEGVPVAHTAQGTVQADGDLDAGEERLVTALFSVTVRRAEAQSASVTLTEIPAPPTE